MDLSVLLEYINIIVLGICLCVGFVIKNSLDFIPNKYIPLIMFVLGTVINIIFNLPNINGAIILTGMISGLASTGLYEMFKNLLFKKKLNQKNKDVKGE